MRRGTEGEEIRKGTRNQSPDKLARVRELRNHPSISEQLIWRFLRKNQTGFRFRRQVPVGPYVLDFYCPEARLAVEVDGEQHDATKDRQRDEWVAQQGILTLRYPTKDLFEAHRLDAILREIVAHCELRAQRNHRDLG